jgi:hypothetical protein
MSIAFIVIIALVAVVSVVALLVNDRERYTASQKSR